MQHIQSEIVALPRFEDFLQAQIGVSEDGMPISVRTAMARQGLDPVGEATRIARLPRPLAQNSLAILIHKIVEGAWPESEVRDKAERLTRLLPSASPTPKPDAAVPTDRRTTLIAVLSFALLLVVTFTLWRGSTLAAVAARLGDWF